MMTSINPHLTDIPTQILTKVKEGEEEVENIITIDQLRNIAYNLLLSL